MLAVKFNPKSKYASPIELDGGVFLDRDPDCFKYILEYLRNGCTLISNLVEDNNFNMVRLLSADADYFGLADLKNICDTILEEHSDEKTKIKTKVTAPTKDEIIIKTLFKTRYNYLRKEGHGTKEAMEMAKVEYPMAAKMQKECFHDLFKKRFSQLRKEGHDTNEAMEMAKAEFHD